MRYTKTMRLINKTIQTLKMTAAAFLLISAFAVVPATPVFAQGNARAQVCESIDGCGSGQGRIQDAIRTVINILSAVGGIIAVIMIIIGGFKFLTAGGDSNSVSSARNTIIYAIVGLIVIAFAQVIVRFVLQKV